MTLQTHAFLARGQVEFDGVFDTSDDPLAAIQRGCGGRVGGQLAVPELRALVAKFFATSPNFSINGLGDVQRKQPLVGANGRGLLCMFCRAGVCPARVPATQ